MKKVILRSLSLATVVVGFTSLSARADDADTDAGKFTPTMELQARYVLTDSTRKTSLDFLSQRFRMGGKYKQGNFTAVGEAEFEGNKYGEYANQTEQNSDGGQSVGVRKAYVGYDLYKEDGSTVNLKLGRFVPAGANQYGDDAMTSWFGISGYLPADGVMLSYAGKLGGVALEAQLSIVNNMSLWVYGDKIFNNNAGVELGDSKTWGFSMNGPSAAFTGGNTFNGNGGGSFNSESANTSNTSDKAYVANVSAGIPAGEGTVEVDVSYMMKNNAIGGTVTSSLTSNVGTTSSTILAQDIQYTEDSIGYNYKDKLMAGVWGSMLTTGESKFMTDDANGGASQFTKLDNSV
ncbi:MAG: hypothetical protein V4591_05460, partial [Bdellovibrionota bacterium]